MPQYNIDGEDFDRWLATEPDRDFPRWDCMRCPLALYIKGHASGAPRVEVGSDGFATIDGISHELPEWTMIFVREFDGPNPNSKPGTAAEARAILHHYVSL